MNQSEFLTITWNLLKAREITRVEGAISFGFCFLLVEELPARDLLANHKAKQSRRR